MHFSELSPDRSLVISSFAFSLLCSPKKQVFLLCPWLTPIQRWGGVGGRKKNTISLLVPGCFLLLSFVWPLLSASEENSEGILGKLSPAMRLALCSPRNWAVLRWQCLGKLPGPRAGGWLWEKCKLLHKVIVNVYNVHITIALRALLLGVSRVVLVSGGYLSFLMAMSQSPRSFTLLNSLLLGKTESSLLFVYVVR